MEDKMEAQKQRDHGVKYWTMTLPCTYSLGLCIPKLSSGKQK